MAPNRDKGVFIVLRLLLACSLVHHCSCLSPLLRSPPILTPDESGVTMVNLDVVVHRVRIESDPQFNIEFTSRVYQISDSARYPDGYVGAPGPLIVVRPGGKLRLTINNKLLKVTHHDDSGHDLRERIARTNSSDYLADESINHWHKVNTTNMHLHGTHVDPKVDDPFRRIGGGDNGSYEFLIPPTHKPGMHWYHAHIHGATSLHVMGGLFGLLLVEADFSLDGGKLPRGGWMRAVPSPNDMASLRFQSRKKEFSHSFRAHLLEERPMLRRFPMAMHMLKFSPKIRKSPHAGWSFAELDTALRSQVRSNATINVDILSINGQFQPVVLVAQGEPVLLHIAFASAFGEPRLLVPETCHAAVVAADGVSYVTPRRVRHLTFVTATRFDVLMQCNHLGVAHVMHDSKGFHDPTYTASTRRLGMEPDVVFKILAVNRSKHSQTDTVNKMFSPSNGSETMEHLFAAWGAVLEAEEEENLRANVSSTRGQEEEVHLKSKWVFLEKLERSHITRGASTVIGDLRRVQRIDLHRDITMSQEAEHSRLEALSAQVTPQADAASPPPIVPLPTIYSIGQGENCDPAAAPADRNCTVEAFHGSRGSNITRYHGFVVKKDAIVEATFFGDPTDVRPHPLHFHVNHFQLVDYVPLSNMPTRDSLLAEWGLSIGDFRDTVPVLPGKLVVRWRTSDFTGEIAYHCHTLSHEDLGMMSTYYVLGDDGVDGANGNGVAISHFSMVASAGMVGDAQPGGGETWALVIMCTAVAGVFWYSYRSMRIMH